MKCNKKKKNLSKLNIFLHPDTMKYRCLSEVAIPPAAVSIKHLAGANPSRSDVEKLFNILIWWL